MECTCPCVLTECTNRCGFVLQRKELHEHLEQFCYLRQVRCEHCGLEGAYEFVVDEHYDSCPKVPVSCPNACSGNPILREELQRHATVCPLEPIQCKFQAIGCNVVVTRSGLQEHLETSQAGHLEMTLSVVSELHQRMEAYRSDALQLREKLENTQEIVKELASRRSSPLSPMLQHLEADAEDSLFDPFLPVIIKMEKFSDWRLKREPWYSPPFYTGTFGYKMCLCVYANGVHNGQGTHLSVYIHLMAGEFDDRLEWPVKEEITIELQNQLFDSHHWSTECHFTQSSPQSITRRVIDHNAIARRGSGSSTFILLSSLGSRECGTPHSEGHCQYLKDDCLFFSVY